MKMWPFRKKDVQPYEWHQVREWCLCVIDRYLQCSASNQLSDFYKGIDWLDKARVRCSDDDIMNAVTPMFDAINEPADFRSGEQDKCLREMREVFKVGLSAVDTNNRLIDIEDRY